MERGVLPKPPGGFRKSRYLLVETRQVATWWFGVLPLSINGEIPWWSVKR
jgi:hypothetical protein